MSRFENIINIVTKAMIISFVATMLLIFGTFLTIMTIEMGGLIAGTIVGIVMIIVSEVSITNCILNNTAFGLTIK